MILAKLGVLATAQDLTEADEISENVIQLPAIDYAAITDVWWVVDTETVAVTTGTIKLELVLATAAGLGTAIQVCCVDIAAITDKRVATAGRHIAALNVGKMLKDMLDTDGSSYPFIGMKNTLSAGVTVSINAALSISEPPTESHAQIVVSNVGIPSSL